MSKYKVGENVPFVFDTAPNVAGLTDMRISCVDVVNDVDITASGGALYDVNAANLGVVGQGAVAAEMTTSPGTYVFNTAALSVGSYLMWLHSVSNGATSSKVLVTVTTSASGDPFYGQAMA